MKNINKLYRAVLLAVIMFSGSFSAFAQETPKEEDFFKIMKVATPEGVILEVGGLVNLPNGNLGISTRRGDVFIVENPTSSRPYFRKFASGLHEILGLAYKDGAFHLKRYFIIPSQTLQAFIGLSGRSPSAVCFSNK